MVSKKQWFWPTVRVGLPILIVVSGAIFVIFAVIYELIDADSARYLLSAIVQALAALLAIIFAGVAILWNREWQAISKLDGLSKDYLSMLKDRMTSIPRGHNEIVVVNYFERLMLSFFKTILYLFEDPAVGEYMGGIARATDTDPYGVLYELLLDSSFGLRGLKLKCFRELLKEDMDVLAEYDSAEFDKLTQFLDRLETTEASKNPEDFFRLLKALSSYLGLIRWFNVDRFTRNHTREILDTLDSSLRQDRVGTLLRVVSHGKRARGGWFKALISLYSITIAVGMVSLSVLKRGIWDIQATWITAGPLFLAICAVALTFYYLARIVSGEKDG